MKGRCCENCGNAKFDVESKKFECQLESEQLRKCQVEYYGLFRSKEGTGIIDAETLAVEVISIIYRRGKAKFFNILESQIENDQRLNASKSIAADALDNICKSVGTLIKDVLVNWQTEVEYGGEVSKEDEREARREYEEAESILNQQ